MNSIEVLERYLEKVSEDPKEKIIVLCDPPWPGGEKYFEKKIICADQFKLAGKNVFQLVFSHDTRCVWVIKVPKNFDILHLIEKIPSPWHIQIWPILNQKKKDSLIFYYLFIYAYQT